MQILVSVSTMGASPQIGEILPPCNFLTILSLPFFSILRPGRNAGLICLLCGSNEVFPCKDGPFAVRMMGDHIWGKYAPKLPKKWA